MTCIKPDYDPEELKNLEKLIKETGAADPTKVEGLGPVCAPIKYPESPKLDLPAHPQPCPLYVDNSASMYRSPGEKLPKELQE